MLTAVKVTVPGPSWVTVPVPLIRLGSVTALGSVNSRVPLLATAPVPRVPTVADGAPVAWPPSARVKLPPMLVPPE